MPLQVQIRIDAERLDKWAGRIKREAPEVFDELLTQGGEIIAKTMRGKAPVKTGFLRESIIIRKGRQSVEVAPTASYAAYVEFGAKPHIIKPVHASVLAFELRGQTVFARSVQHPGFKGRFFVKNTKEECLPQIQELTLALYKQLFAGES